MATFTLANNGDGKTFKWSWSLSQSFNTNYYRAIVLDTTDHGDSCSASSITSPSFSLSASSSTVSSTNCTYSSTVTLGYTPYYYCYAQQASSPYTWYRVGNSYQRVYIELYTHTVTLELTNVSSATIAYYNKSGVRTPDSGYITTTGGDFTVADDKNFYINGISASYYNWTVYKNSVATSTSGTGSTVNYNYTGSSDVTLNIVNTKPIVKYTLTYSANGGSSTPTGGSYEEDTYVTLASAISRQSNIDEERWTVSLDANGGTCSPTSLSTGYNEVFTYTFTGWKSSYDSKTYNAGQTTWQMPASDVTLTAQWKTNTGTKTIISKELPTATRTGYVFQGWYTKGGTFVGWDGEYVHYEEDITLIAHWKAKYTLTYSANGGTSTPTGGYYEEGTYVTLANAISHNSTTDEERWTIRLDCAGGSCSPSTLSTGYNQLYTYTFNGWYDSYRKQTYNAGQTTWSMPASNVTLSAQWKINTGTKTIVSATLPTPTYGSYVFNGWYTAGGNYVGWGGDSVHYEEDITLIAHWGGRYSLSYDSAGGTSTPTGGSYEEGTYVTLANAVSKNTTTEQERWTVIFDYNGGTGTVDSTRTGDDLTTSYTFKGWYDSYRKQTYNAGQTTWQMPASDVVMTAQYTTSSSSVDVRSTLPVATRNEDYTFLGWYTSGGTYVGVAGDYICYKEDITLVAKWKKLITYTYSVTYYSDDVISKLVSTGEVEDDTYTFTLAYVPTKTNYTFKGWDTSSAAVDVVYARNSTVTLTGKYATNINLYAVWTRETYHKFYWDGNDGSLDSSIIYQGGPVTNLTADRWNKLNEKIQEINLSYTFNYVKSGDSFTAKLYNDTRAGIEALTEHGTLPSEGVKGTTIYAVFLNGSNSLKSALNDAIDYKNKFK